MATAPVSVWLPGELAPVLAGAFEWDKEARTGQFRYAQDYLDHPAAVALDPIHLPLRGSSARTRKQDGIFGVLRDAGPDSWGEAQMRYRFGMPSMDPFERITLCSPNGAGRVLVGDASAKREVPIWDLHKLETAYATWIESDRSRPHPIEEFVAQRAPYTGTGGAKPKLDLLFEGRMWLVKFPERGDPADLAGIEATALSLAHACGIEAPAHRVQGLSFEGDTRYGLMVERFDRQQFAGGFARHGFASAHTVMDLDAGDESGRQRSYLAFAHETVRWCATGQDRRHGQQQKREIWRRVVFNGLVGNTDDHSRNHALLQDNGATWRLSPIFDVVPTPQRAGAQLALMMPFTNEREFANYVTAARLIGSAAGFGWDVHEAEAELQRMASIVNRDWEPLMGTHGVSRDSIEKRASAFGFAREIAGGAG